MSSASGMGMAQELLEVQPVNGFCRNAESQSRPYLNGAGSDQSHAPRVIRRELVSLIVHVSSAMAEIINKIERQRDSEAPTLITGETGTGKELIARVVHDLSPRRERSFIPFNCGGGPRELIASWLFGHQRGSFTGADRNVKGVIREADGGTLLLDEVGDLSLDLQCLLLRPLQEGEVHPLGAPKPIKTDVRVIAATNRDLEVDIQSGRFRDDLYWRLNVSRIHIPPLRERREEDRKSTRLNSSHLGISYAVFCLKKKKNTKNTTQSHIKSTKSKQRSTHSQKTANAEQWKRLNA